MGVYFTQTFYNRGSSGAWATCKSICISLHRFVRAVHTWRLGTGTKWCYIQTLGSRYVTVYSTYMYSLSPCQTPFWNLNLARESKKQRISLVTVSTWQNSVFILVPSEYRNGARCQGTMCGGCLSFHSKCGAGSILRLIRCLMVGLPWGQFQGCSIFLMWQATSFFCVWLSEAPTLMVTRHAQLANIFLTLEGLHRENRSTWKSVLQCPWHQMSSSCSWEEKLAWPFSLPRHCDQYQNQINSFEIFVRYL